MKSFIKIFIITLLCCQFINALAQQKNQFVKIETAQGYCIVKLYNETPNHRDNFIKLVKAHYFDATTFNRILKGFVIQGGDQDSLYIPSKTLKPEQKWIRPEFNPALFHKRGVLAMGRDDNKEKASFTTQIYFVDGKTYTNEQLDSIEKKIWKPLYSYPTRNLPNHRWYPVFRPKLYCIWRNSKRYGFDRQNNRLTSK